MTDRAWKMARDTVLVGLGMFMLLHETLSSSPNPIIIGAAFGLFGLPVPLRIDERRKREKEGNGE